MAVVLVFVGVKMLLTDVFHIPTLASLAVIIVSLGVAVAASGRKARSGETQAA